MAQNIQSKRTVVGPEVLDRLISLLRTYRESSHRYPCSLGHLLEAAGQPPRLASGLTRAQSLRRHLVFTASTKATSNAAEAALVGLVEDAEQVLTDDAVLRGLLTQARTAANQAFSIAELAKRLYGKQQGIFRSYWEGALSSGKAPPGVGSVVLSRARKLFLLSDVVPPVFQADQPQRHPSTEPHLEQATASALAHQPASVCSAPEPWSGAPGFGEAFVQEQSLVERVLAAAQRLRRDTGLVFVPELVEGLRRQLGQAAIHRALLEASSAGRLELRPEGGLGRLTAEELAACLPGPAGTLLSWLRLIEEGNA